MIEKDPGNPQLHHLCVIHLYESEYNSLLGIKMRHFIHNAKDKKVLTLAYTAVKQLNKRLDKRWIQRLLKSFNMTTQVLLVGQN
jgi:hypothetical protein